MDQDVLELIVIELLKLNHHQSPALSKIWAEMNQPKEESLRSEDEY